MPMSPMFAEFMFCVMLLSDVEKNILATDPKKLTNACNDIEYMIFPVLI